MAKAGIIYSILDQEWKMIGGGHFIPTWDSTDHLHFACEECLSGNSTFLKLCYFRMKCESLLCISTSAVPCAGTPVKGRSIWGGPNDSAKNQEDFNDRELLYYGKGRKPALRTVYKPLSAKEPSEEREKLLRPENPLIH